MSQRDDIISPQVATDVIEELCYEMGLQRAEALDEYAVFLVTQRGNAALLAQPSQWQHLTFLPSTAVKTSRTCVPCVGQNVRPLNKREYILDIATEAEPVDSNYSLWFRRVIWSLALKLDNELYVTMHYNQVKRCTPVHLQTLAKTFITIQLSLNFLLQQPSSSSANLFPSTVI